MATCANGCCTGQSVEQSVITESSVGQCCEALFLTDFHTWLERWPKNNDLKVFFSGH